MFTRILIPLDMSPAAEQALPWARLLAARQHGTVAFLHLLEPMPEVVPPTAAGEMEMHARAYLENAAAPFRADGITVECVIKAGAPAHGILDYAAAWGATLIAMSTHGRGGVQRWVYGSVANKIVHAASAPVLLVRAQAAPLAAAAPPAALRRLLVPLDRSPLAEQALPPAVDLARAFDAELLLYHVWDTAGYTFDASNDPKVERIMRDTYVYSETYMVDVTRRLTADGVRVHWLAESGDVAQHILSAAEHEDADLIVMSTHGLSGISRWVLGSIADRVLRHASKPLLLVRAQAA
jgi:nucleotide-binding universal stress UspA family protein